VSPATRVCRSLDELRDRLPGLVLTVGNFDGVHLGHRRILETVIAAARARRGTAAALTFEPHPARILHPERAPQRLTTPEQKLALLEAAGLDLVVVLPFNLELSQLTPRQFVEEMLHRRLATQQLCVGENFRFGHKQAGDVALLKELAAALGVAVEVIAPVVVRGQTVSSSLVRKLIASGGVDKAARFLGRPFALTGKVEPGAGRARALGFPTLNTQPEQECLPARGVYVTEVALGARLFSAATNVGVRPTFDGQSLTVESHLLDFEETVAAGRLEVRLLEHLREEKKFDSPEALRAQIARDLDRARRYFAQRAQSDAQKQKKLEAAG